jgi:ABC-type antimicrobial peptide transport system permease subunit
MAALLLASVGIYGLIGFASAQRFKEFGLRAALGASRRRIFGMVLLQALRSVLLAICIGMPLSYVAAPTLRSLLVGIQPHDWASFVTVPFVLITFALLASTLPAWRATRADPATCLRTE